MLFEIFLKSQGKAEFLYPALSVQNSARWPSITVRRLFETNFFAYLNSFHLMKHWIGQAGEERAINN